MVQPATALGSGVWVRGVGIDDAGGMNYRSSRVQLLKRVVDVVAQR